MSSPEEIVLDFMLGLEELRQILDPKRCLVSQTTELFGVKGDDCKHVQTGMRIFWAKDKDKVIDLISKLSGIVSQLPPNNALDNEHFHYSVTNKKANP